MQTIEIKEIDNLRTRLSKGIDNGETKLIIKLLESLKRLNMTKNLLKETKIGSYLTEVRKKSDVKISAVCKDVIAKWKQDIEFKPKSASRTSSISSLDNRNLNFQNNTPSVKPIENVRRKMSSDTVTVNKAPPKVAERTILNDGIKHTPLPDQYRDKILGVMYSALGLGNTHDNDDLYKLACEIEMALFKNFNIENKDYKLKAASLNFNLRDKSNPDLKLRVLNHELSCEDLVNMTPDEMASNSRKQLLEELKKQSDHKSQGAATQEAETDMFKCGKCGKRKCTYFQKQTRSADEPMTTFVTCVNCNNHWKFC